MSSVGHDAESVQSTDMRPPRSTDVPSGFTLCIESPMTGGREPDTEVINAARLGQEKRRKFKNKGSLALPTVDVFTHTVSIWTVRHTFCQYVPHSMHPTCKIGSFLQLRIMCKALLTTISSQLGHRLKHLFRHTQPDVRAAAKHIKDSGILFQFWLPHSGRRLGHLTWIDVVDSKGRVTGRIPEEMAPEYYADRQRRGFVTGWLDDGRLLL